MRDLKIGCTPYPTTVSREQECILWPWRQEPDRSVPRGRLLPRVVGVGHDRHGADLGRVLSEGAAVILHEMLLCRGDTEILTFLVFTGELK